MSSNINNGNNSSHVLNEPPATDALEERVIDAEYKIWKKNTPYLYDFVLTHSLEWPSLTCQWLPAAKPTISSSQQLSGAGGIANASLGNSSSAALSSSTSASASGQLAASEHSLLLGTHTTGEQNYLMMASCIIPQPEPVVPLPPNAKLPRYDEEKKEIGGFGTVSGTSTIGKIEIKRKIKHEGEVNRARYMPQNHFIVATRGPSPELYIWDLSKHPSFPAENSVFRPQGVCIGHEQEGYAMVWSSHESGRLLSGSEDTTVRLWDVNVVANATSNSGNTDGTQIQPLVTLSSGGHTDTVEDVDWHHFDSQLVISVGDDKRICLWDLREPSKPRNCVSDAHESDINCVAFNPKREFLFATGSADATVAIWDLRNLSQKMHSLRNHSDQVFKVEWAPFNESILGSCSADRRVALWDLSRVGQEQSIEDAEDGPPELLFVHGGHTSKVSDFSWNTNDEWTIASVSEDNVLQVWNIAEEIYALDDDNYDGDDNANNDSTNNQTDEEGDDTTNNNINKSSNKSNKEEDARSCGAGEDGMLGEDELE